MGTLAYLLLSMSSDGGWKMVAKEDMAVARYWGDEREAVASAGIRVAVACVREVWDGVCYTGLCYTETYCY